ncbi:MAG: hypothetical protein ACREBG_07735, partial [Pyrinomonadaceae bacterium]
LNFRRVQHSVFGALAIACPLVGAFGRGGVTRTGVGGDAAGLVSGLPILRNHDDGHPEGALLVNGAGGGAGKAHLIEHQKVLAPEAHEHTILARHKRRAALATAIARACVHCSPR